MAGIEWLRCEVRSCHDIIEMAKASRLDDRLKLALGPDQMARRSRDSKRLEKINKKLPRLIGFTRKAQED